ncbi:hypothetical protein ACIGO9_03920 [Nocardia asteroides]|uniref:hypothetical protein n=1 Tax=Nocardia asteroides TaxID=1824 RepID=UPI0037C78607
MPGREDVVGYLRAQGWQPREYWRNGTVWTHGEFDVLVPGDEVVDFVPRIRDLIRCVADAEQRDAEVIVREIVSGGVDIVGYGAGDHGDDISIEVCAAALTALYSLLAASAQQAAGEIRAARVRRLAVAEFLGATTLSPRRDTFGFDVFLAGPGSALGRTSAVRLLDLAATVQQAARGDGEIGLGLAREIREDAVAAFGALGAADLDPIRFELSFHWSWRVPRPDVVVEFSSAAVARLPELFAVAAAPPPADDPFDSQLASPGAVVDGELIGLDIDDGPKAIVRGVLSVDGVTTGRRRRITVHLPTDADYVNVLAALPTRARVRATGIFDGKRDLQASENGFAVLEHGAP